MVQIRTRRQTLILTCCPHAHGVTSKSLKMPLEMDFRKYLQCLGAYLAGYPFICVSLRLVIYSSPVLQRERAFSAS